jgi:hypothetical protein
MLAKHLFNTTEASNNDKEFSLIASNHKAPTSPHVPVPQNVWSLLNSKGKFECDDMTESEPGLSTW